MTAPRREGDPSAIWADTRRAEAMLGWHATRTLDDIISSAWRWHTRHPDGYQSTDAASEGSAAVCIVSRRPDDRSLVIRVGDIIRRRLGKDAAMDVLFLTAEQEADVTRACQPFYAARE